MELTERAKTPLKLLAFAIGGYLVVSVVSGGIGLSLPMPSLPSISLPTLSMPSISGNTSIMLALFGLAGVYALATKRGWRADIRAIIQVVTVALLAYLVVRIVGPSFGGVIPI